MYRKLQNPIDGFHAYNLINDFRDRINRKSDRIYDRINR